MMVMGAADRSLAALSVWWGFAGNFARSNGFFINPRITLAISDFDDIVRIRHLVVRAVPCEARGE